MSALFSAALAKAAAFLFSFLIVSSGLSSMGTKIVRLPIASLVSVHQEERADTTETQKPEKPAQEKAEVKPPAKLPKKRKPVKISISDEGITVGGESGEEKVILEIDPGEIGKALDEAADFEWLEDLPESMAVMLLDDEDRAYVKIRGNDVVRFGEDIHVGRRELVQGDVVAIGGDIVIEGKVRGNVVNVFGDTELQGTAVINGDVVTVMGTLSEYNDPRVRGETVTVGGFSPNIKVPFMTFGPHGVWNIISKVIKFIIFTILLLMIIYFLPDRMEVASDHVFGSFFKSLGIGILVLLVGSIVVLILSVILSITIIGIPVAVLLILSYGALLLLGYFVSALALGRIVCSRFGPDGASLILCGFMGLFLLNVPGFIAGMMWVLPFLMPVKLLLQTISVFLNFLAISLGSGALLLSKAGALKLERRPNVPGVPPAPGGPEYPSSGEE